jgi:hypothetical protein
LLEAESFDASDQHHGKRWRKQRMMEAQYGQHIVEVGAVAEQSLVEEGGALEVILPQEEEELGQDLEDQDVRYENISQILL